MEAEQQISDMTCATHALADQFGAHVHVTWTDELDGRKTGFYAFSPDSGATWGAPEQLTTEGEWWAGPVGPTANQVIATIHPDTQTEIYYRRRNLSTTF